MSCRGLTAASRVAERLGCRTATLDPAVKPRGDKRTRRWWTTSRRLADEIGQPAQPCEPALEPEPEPGGGGFGLGGQVGVVGLGEVEESRVVAEIVRQQLRVAVEAEALD